MQVLNEFFLGFARVVASTLKGASNAILANLELEDDDDGVEGSSEEPMYGQIGFYCRPMPAVDADAADGLNPEGAAEVVAFRHGDQVIPVGGRDLRLNKQVNPSDGSVGLAHYGGGFCELSWNASKDGTVVTLYALRKKADGTADKASVLTLNSEADDASVILLHESGQSITLGPDGQILMCNAGGDAYLEIKDDGKIILNGAALSLVGGAMVGSPDPSAGDAVMLSTAQLAWVGEVNACLTLADTQLKALGAAGLAPLPTTVPLAASKLKAL